MKAQSEDANARTILTWLAVALIGAASLGGIALNRGEPVNSFWFVTAAVCVYALGYRFYSAFVAAKMSAKQPAFSSRPSVAKIKA